MADYAPPVKDIVFTLDTISDLDEIASTEAAADALIERGGSIDLLVLNGDPLELTSATQVVIVNGKILYQGEGQ